MEWIDCTQPLETGMPVYPGTDPVEIEPVDTVASAGAHTTGLQLQSHVGTHVDVPRHMEPDGRDLDDYSVADWVFDARTVDCTEKTDREPITREDLQPATDHELLLIRTDWSVYWGTDRYRDHPYLTAEAARWCADQGYSVAIDAFSPDPTPSIDPARERETEPADYPAHAALFERDRRIVENVTNLTAVSETCTVHAQPLSIPGGDGSPARVVARCD